MKFSIIIPVYNVEKYIDKCLQSISNQTYTNYEMIIVNDGSTDNSSEIIKKYTKKNDKIKYYSKKNGGLSDARNYGLKHVTGDYIIFLDSDDYLEKHLLEKINDALKKDNYDIIKFLFNIEDENGNTLKQEKSNLSGEVNFEEIITLEYSNSACCYAFNTIFWNKYNFKFKVGKVHEDFGLIPKVLVLSKKTYILNYLGYNYIQRNQSITNGSEKAKRRANDVLYHYDQLLKEIEKYDISDNNLKLYKSYIANGTINIAKILNGEDLKKYLKELKNKKIYKNLLDNSFGRKIKKIMVKINIELYMKIFDK